MLKGIMCGMKTIRSEKGNPINLLSILIEIFLLFLTIEKQNGDNYLPQPRAKRKFSVGTESLYSRHSHRKISRSETPHSELEHSWIYALCMRCRVECEFVEILIET